MKKDGFTLMELLSVIIIIAIVALIAIPIILNTIEKSKQGAFLDSAYGIVKSAEYAYLSMLEKGINEDINFTYQNGNVTSTNNDVELNYTGQKPFNGEVKIYKDGKIALAITNGVYCATKSPDESRITIDMDDEICGLDSEGAPTYDFANLGFDEIKGVNKPVLADNMIPIKWDENNVDTHLIKNTEWGAIAYLSKSIYGADDNEVWNNSFTQYKSGCSGSDVNAYNESVCVEYNTENGVKASTTYNIYGVYDMAGGSRERTAAYIDNSNENLRNYGNALFMEAEPKYKNVYVVNATESNQTTYQNSRLIYGDAIFETSNAYTDDYGSWFNDFSYIPRVASPFFIRGSILAPSGGMYGFGYYNGSAHNNDSFRPILFVYE